MSSHSSSSFPLASSSLPSSSPSSIAASLSSSIAASLSSSSDSLSDPSPSSIPGFRSASTIVVPEHWIAEPMDWQPEGILAVEAWKYQKVTLPALVAAGGPFSLPPLYAYFPAPINWAATGEFARLSENGGTQEQFLQFQLDLASWHSRHLAAAIEQDKLFLESRYWAAVRKWESLGELMSLLRQQEAVQEAFAGRPDLLQLFVAQQQQQHQVPSQQLPAQSLPSPLTTASQQPLLPPQQLGPLQPTETQLRIRENLALARGKQVQHIAAFGSSSSSSAASAAPAAYSSPYSGSSQSSLASSTSSAAATSSISPFAPAAASSSTPTPAPALVSVKPGVVDQGSALRGLAAPDPSLVSVKPGVVDQGSALRGLAAPDPSLLSSSARLKAKKYSSEVFFDQFNIVTKF